MNTVGLRELRQSASDLVRRVEDGEEFVVTVAGRLSARLVPVQPPQWRTWDDIEAIFAGPIDVNWRDDMDLIDQDLYDPWSDA